MLGEPDTVVTGVPTAFMIVADPIGAGIIADHDRSGRPMVTGTLNRVPEETHMRVLEEGIKRVAEIVGTGR